MGTPRLLLHAQNAVSLLRTYLRYLDIFLMSIRGEPLSGAELVEMCVAVALKFSAAGLPLFAMRNKRTLGTLDV